MRRFQKPEIFRAKCPVCGCKNKIYSEYHNEFHKLIGYTLKCCGCGNRFDFVLDDRYIDKMIQPKYHVTEDVCLQPSFCPHKHCKYYNKYHFCHHNCCTCRHAHRCKHRKYTNHDSETVVNNKVRVTKIQDSKFL